MKKIKFMLLSLALVAVVGGALAFKARYHTTFCTTFATRVDADHPWTCQIEGQAVLTCPTITTTTVAAPVNDQIQPVCTTILKNGTCGNSGSPLDCQTTTKTLVQD
jgi:hypothetical protein